MFLQTWGRSRIKGESKKKRKKQQKKGDFALSTKLPFNEGGGWCEIKRHNHFLGWEKEKKREKASRWAFNEQEEDD